MSIMIGSKQPPIPPDLLPEPSDIIVLDVHAIQHHSSLQWIIEALNQANNSTLATAGLSNQSNCLTCEAEAGKCTTRLLDITTL